MVLYAFITMHEVSYTVFIHVGFTMAKAEEWHQPVTEEPLYAKQMRNVTSIERSSNASFNTGSILGFITTIIYMYLSCIYKYI